MGEGAHHEQIGVDRACLGQQHLPDGPVVRRQFNNILTDQGPRMGSFIALYGRDETEDLIKRVLAGEDISKD